MSKSTKTAKSSRQADQGKRPNTSMEDRLYGIVDLRQGTFEFDGLMPNPACSFATRCLEELLINREPSEGFLGLGGHIEFPGRAFPDSHKQPVEDQLKAMLALLAAGESEAVGSDHTSSRYQMYLFRSLDRAKIVERIESVERERQDKVRKLLESEDEKGKRREEERPKAEHKEADWATPVAALLEAVPASDTFTVQSKELAALSHEFRQQLAARLQRPLNEYLETVPHDTLDQKKELARWVNAELERFGLAIKCQKTGLPAKLRGLAGHWVGVGRFAIEIYADGKQKFTSLSDQLPKLELTDAGPEQVPEIGWQEKVGAKSSRKGRKLT